MTDVLEFTDFAREWMKMEYDRRRQVLSQLKRELARERRGRSDRRRQSRPAVKMGRG